jgi:uncharacterized membrane protein
MKETSSRSITKALTYRAWQSLNTFLISLLVTGRIDLAAAIVSIEVVVKIVVYFFHERIWSRINWGIREDLSHPPLDSQTRP